MSLKVQNDGSDKQLYFYSAPADTGELICFLREQFPSFSVSVGSMLGSSGAVDIFEFHPETSKDALTACLNRFSELHK